MHHTLPLYGRFRHKFLKLYIFLARFTRIPLLGRSVRWAANIYGRTRHGGYFITLKQAGQLIDASGYVALGPCACRQVFQNCEHPVMTEIVIGAGEKIYSKTETKEFRQISREKAKEVLHQRHRSGMIHTIMQCQGLFYAICSCCPCCCVPLRLKKNYGIDYSVAKSGNIVADFQKQLQSLR